MDVSRQHEADRTADEGGAYEINTVSRDARLSEQERPHQYEHARDR